MAQHELFLRVTVATDQSPGAGTIERAISRALLDMPSCNGAIVERLSVPDAGEAARAAIEARQPTGLLDDRIPIPASASNLTDPPVERPRLPNPPPDPQRCPGNDGGPHDFDPSNKNRGRVCPRCGAANPVPLPGPKPAFQGDTLLEP